MTLAYRTGEHHPLLAALGLSTGRFRRANLDIHAADEMLQHFRNLNDGRDRAFVQYFESGRRIWQTMAEILRWRFGRTGPDFRLLDFASGYGRVTRFAVLDLPPERIWVADVYAGGVRFQQEAFGVHGLVSHADPERFDCEGRFDAVFVSSLFTHLPVATFRAWFLRLFGLLRPGGVLAFSVHNEDLLPPGRTLPPSGIRFEPTSESGSLPSEQYGTTWVDEQFVRRVLGELAPESSARRFPRALLSFQDLWIVVPEPDCDFSGLQLHTGPDSFIEHCSEASGRLRMAGWVVDRVRRSAARELRVSAGGEVLLVVSDFQVREDLGVLFPYERVTGYGFRFEVDLPPGALEGNASLALDVVLTEGETFRLYEGTLAAALLRSARLDLYLTTTQLGQRTLELNRERTRTEALEAQLTAMQASRFWKLRNAWFRLKRALGLTEEV